MNYRNLKIKASGKFYTSSREKTEGAVEFVHEKEGTFYHTEYNQVEGILTSIDRKTVEYTKSGEQKKLFLLEIVFMDNEKDLKTTINIPLRDNYGVNAYTAEVIKFLPNLTLGKPTTIWINSKNKNAKGKVYKNLGFKQDGERIDWSFTFKDLPANKEVKKYDAIEDKEIITYDRTESDKFLMEKLKAGIEKLKSTENITNQNTSTTPPPETVGDDLDDQLPF